jgi:hypothetical protein
MVSSPGEPGAPTSISAHPRFLPGNRFTNWTTRLGSLSVGIREKNSPGGDRCRRGDPGVRPWTSPDLRQGGRPGRRRRPPRPGPGGGDGACLQSENRRTRISRPGSSDQPGDRGPWSRARAGKEASLYLFNQHRGKRLRPGDGLARGNGRIGFCNAQTPGPGEATPACARRLPGNCEPATELPLGLDPGGRRSAPRNRRWPGEGPVRGFRSYLFMRRSATKCARNRKNRDGHRTPAGYPSSSSPISSRNQARA